MIKKEFDSELHNSKKKRTYKQKADSEKKQIESWYKFPKSIQETRENS